jgi:hypothetical protein
MLSRFWASLGGAGVKFPQSATRRIAIDLESELGGSSTGSGAELPVTDYWAALLQ